MEGLMKPKMLLVITGCDPKKLKAVVTEELKKLASGKIKGIY
jgi:hypothetical protein